MPLEKPNKQALLMHCAMKTVRKYKGEKIYVTRYDCRNTGKYFISENAPYSCTINNREYYKD